MGLRAGSFSGDEGRSPMARPRAKKRCRFFEKVEWLKARSLMLVPSRVEARRGAGLSASPFPRFALRTGRACYHASGSP
jgi:hypothetical protein